jgi:hypothetical protein
VMNGLCGLSDRKWQPWTANADFPGYFSADEVKIENLMKLRKIVYKFRVLLNGGSGV